MNTQLITLFLLAQPIYQARHVVHFSPVKARYLFKINSRSREES